MNSRSLKHCPSDTQIPGQAPKNLASGVGLQRVQCREIEIGVMCDSPLDCVKSLAAAFWTVCKQFKEKMY